MASIVWIPAILAVWSGFLYYMSVNLPEHAGTDRSALQFPRSLEDLNSLAGLLKAYKDDNFYYLMVLYCSAYLFKQTFAIPGSFFMNMLGGTLFGIWKSFPLVCVLSASGATTCFLLSNLCGKAFIVKYFPNKVAYMQKKVTDNMDSLFFFLLFLRLFPMSPNWFLNMASPILDVPVHLFFMSVLVGLMPYNFICVQTGDMLSEINSLDDVFTWSTTIKLIGIAMAALLPGLLINKFKHGRLKVD